jgi:Fe-S-cluster containining protein
LSTIDHTTESIKHRADQRKSANKDLLSYIKRKPPQNLDYIMQELHEQAFEEIDCLTCANCCRTTSPIVTDRDIDRIAKHLRTKPGELIAKYLRLDEEGDYVFRSAPCPFLQNDNACSIYDNRPQACRTYPHTDRKKFQQLADLTYKNSFICPAVQRILEMLEVKIPSKK